MSRHTRAVLVAATTTALAASVPATTGLANTGGVPHSTKACPTQSHSGKHKGATKGLKKGTRHGKRCGQR
jgi:hypothetical protein